jgi:hypothetical protein
MRGESQATVIADAVWAMYIGAMKAHIGRLPSKSKHRPESSS